MNMVTARLTRMNGELVASFGEHRLVLPDARPALQRYENGEIVLGIRPEDLEDAAFAAGAQPGRTLTTVCTLREALGSEVLLHFPATGDGTTALIARVDSQTSVREGDAMQLVVDTSRLHFFDPVSGLAL
jgi:multiple sugar transport system ATP-binding protein